MHYPERLHCKYPGWSQVIRGREPWGREGGEEGGREGTRAKPGNQLVYCILVYMISKYFLIPVQWHAKVYCDQQMLVPFSQCFLFKHRVYRVDSNLQVELFELNIQHLWFVRILNSSVFFCRSYSTLHSTAASILISNTHSGRFVRLYNVSCMINVTLPDYKTRCATSTCVPWKQDNSPYSHIFQNEAATVYVRKQIIM